MTHVSKNCCQLWDTDTGHLLNQDALSLLTPVARHGVRGALNLRTIYEQREQLEPVDLCGRKLDIALHCVGGNGILELELAPNNGAGAASGAHTRALLSGAHGELGTMPMLQSEVKTLRHLSGFDRVMVYRFLEGGDGEVIAEALGPGREPYLGLRYPAYDIPPQARQIALEMPMRVIADTQSPNVELVGASNAPLNLTRAHARGVSPVHLEYLRNMGVRASMGISLVVGGKLWGLISFHHYRPRVLPAEERNVFEIFGRLLSMRLSLAEQEQARRKHQRCVEMLRATEAETSVGTWVSRVGPNLLPLLELDGFAVSSKGNDWTVGTVPDTEVRRQLSTNTWSEPLVTDNLAALHPDASHANPLVAGAVVYPIHAPSQTHAMFFRKEVIEEVRWGGNPDKTIEQGPHGPRLSPRASFAEYRRTMRGRSKTWLSSDFGLMGEVARSLLEVLLSSTNTEGQVWVQQRGEMKLLVAELNHRVKNTLALVSALVNQTRTSAESLDDYASALQRRLSALALAHDLVGAQTLQWADLGTIFDKELQPYPVAYSRATRIGPSVQLQPTIVTTVCLVLHELVSNAAKYGALALDNTGASLKITWAVDEEFLVVDWLEVGLGPLPSSPRHGFGRALIEGAIPHQLGGDVEFDLRDGELHVRMRLPGHLCRVQSEIEWQALSHAAPPPSTPGPALRQSTVSAARASRVLVVEDNPVQALDVERLLHELGFAEVDVRGSAEELQDLQTYDVALLDVHLGRSDSFELAGRLIRRGTPVIFATGYGSALELPEGLDASSLLVKPLDPRQLEQAILTQLTRPPHTVAD